MKTVKVGILGGSFNPIHNGHMEVAKYLFDNGYVDSIKVMTTIGSPFKLDTDEPDAYYRYQMVKLACKDYNKGYPNPFPGIFDFPFTPSNYEMVNYCDKECAYSVDMLKRLVYENLDDSYKCEYHFIMGYDTFNNLDKFKNYQWLLRSGLVKLIVVCRPGYSHRPSFVTDDSQLDNVIFVDGGPMNDISSTMIREKIANGKIDECKEYMSEEVINYIKKNKLYGV